MLRTLLGLSLVYGVARNFWRMDVARPLFAIVAGDRLRAVFTSPFARMSKIGLNLSVPIPAKSTLILILVGEAGDRSAKMSCTGMSSSDFLDFSQVRLTIRPSTFCPARSNDTFELTTMCLIFSRY